MATEDDYDDAVNDACAVIARLSEKANRVALALKKMTAERDELKKQLAAAKKQLAARK